MISLKPAGGKDIVIVFVFEVKLRPGMNTLMAEAGSAYDTAELEKVDLEPAVYTLPSA